MDFWLRSATLQIGGNRYSMDDLAFDFEVPFEDGDELTTATVNAYNLSANTRNSIKKGDPVIINAGYEGDLGVIFVGQVSGLSHKHSSTEWTTKITATEALDQWLTAQVNKTYTKSIKAKACKTFSTSSASKSEPLSSPSTRNTLAGGYARESSRTF